MQAVLDGVERSHFWMSVWQQCEKRKEFLDFKSCQFIEDNSNDSDCHRELHVSKERQNVAFRSM
jgi:hypothetical protein